MKQYKITTVATRNSVDKWLRGDVVFGTETVKVECNEGAIKIGDKIANKMYIVAIEEI